MQRYIYTKGIFFLFIFFLSFIQLRAQDISVSGKVTDEKGEPLIGVTVVVKGTSTGTITDVDGNFKVNVPVNAVLQISFIGYVSKEIPVNGQSTFNIMMEPSVVTMDEVVVVAYGVVDKKDLTGSVSVLNESAISSQPVIRLESALQARIAGVQVNQNSGNPGESLKVRIRGANSFSGDNQPLYVIDGFIGADIQSINPADIASISVLKDASATALYGSLGANGVVLITTKQGKQGKTSIDLKLSQTVSQLRTRWDLLEGFEYMQLRNDRLLAQGTLPANLPFSTADIIAEQVRGGTDWQDEIFQLGNQSQIQLNVRKGSFYISGSAQTNKGIVKGTEYNRYTMRLTYDEKIFKPVKLFLSVSNGFEDRVNADVVDLENIIRSAIGWPTNIPVIDPLTGDYSRNQAYGTLLPNPVYIIKERNDRSMRNDFLANGFLEFDIAKGLKFKTQGAVNLKGISSTSFNRVNPNEVVNNPDNSSYGNTNRMVFNWQATQQLSYNRSVGIHSFNVTALYETLSNAERTFSAGGVGLSTQDLGFYSAPVASFQSNGSGKSNKELRSVFGRINYTLKDKYLFTFNARYDESSALGDGYKGAPFYGGAIAYRISEESFLKSIEVIDELKLRLSAGQVGSQSVGFTQTKELVGYNIGYSFDGSTNDRGAILPNPRNPKLTWETTNQVDFGIDLSLWSGKASVTTDFFYKRTTGLIFSRTVPSYLGGGTILVNSGENENKGFELTLSGYPITKTNFSVETSLNFSVLRNQLLDIIGENTFIISGKNPRDEPDLQDNSHRNFVGRPIGLLWGFNYLGVYGTDEAAQAAAYGRSPGDAKYQDLNNDGVINNSDMMVIGNPNPDFTWGFITNVKYKNWSMNMVWSGVHGVDVFNSVKYFTYGGARDATNRDLLNRWTPENQDSNIPGYTTTSLTQRQSSQWIENGSFIKLRNITINYELPVKSISWMKAFTSISASLSAQNAIVITKYSGYDPESLSSVGDRAGGFDDGGYPIPRSFVLGINFGF
jgi:TonB-dependent starch-binding outer membrane protein SusC